MGHTTKGTEHEVPINLEIDKLFNVIDKVKEKDVREEKYQDVRELYQLVMDEKNKIRGVYG